MGDSLQGKLIANTYPGLIKTSDNDCLDAGTIRITDGKGCDTALCLGACTQSSEFTGPLTVTGSFAANGITYPTAIGTANHVLLSDGTAAFSVGQVPTAGLADLDPSPAGGGKPNYIDVNSKGQTTTFCSAVPGFSAFGTPGNFEFDFPAGVCFVKFIITGSGGRATHASSGAGGTVTGYIRKAPGTTIHVQVAAAPAAGGDPSHHTYITTSDPGVVANLRTTQLAMASGGVGNETYGTGNNPGFNKIDCVACGIICNHDGSLISPVIIPGGGGGVDATPSNGQEEGYGGASFWGSAPAPGAGAICHANSTQNSPGKGYALFEWS